MKAAGFQGLRGLPEVEIETYCGLGHKPEDVLVALVAILTFPFLLPLAVVV